MSSNGPESSDLSKGTETPSFTTASPGFLTRLNSISQNNAPDAAPQGTLAKLIDAVPEDDEINDDVSVVADRQIGDTVDAVSGVSEKKEKKKDKKKSKKGSRVLVYDPVHGYHYATVAGEGVSIPAHGDGSVALDAGNVTPSGVSSDTDVEDNQSIAGESDAKAAKKAAKKAEKAAKKEAKRLKKEQEKMAQAAALGLQEVPLSSMQEQSENIAEDAAGAISHANVLAQPARRVLLPGQVNITGQKNKRAQNEAYERELAKLQIELVKLQAWIKSKGLKVVVIFEGRDAAGKGGVIKRITERLNPRICRVCALGTATEREKTQWYFQRYVSQLPAAGEMVLFDRSWYNRGGVEKVMGFCTDEEYSEFMSSCPIFEDMLIRSGIILIKYWFSVSDDVQEKRFQGRIADSTKRWKLSPMDVESRDRWVEYSKAKDEMLKYTDTDSAPWVHVHADSKKLARLNCISHLLSTIPYQDLTPPPTILPPRKHCQDYVRPPMTAMKWVPEKFV